LWDTPLTSSGFLIVSVLFCVLFAFRPTNFPFPNLFIRRPNDGFLWPRMRPLSPPVSPPKFRVWGDSHFAQGIEPAPHFLLQFFFYLLDSGPRAYQNSPHPQKFSPISPDCGLNYWSESYLFGGGPRSLLDLSLDCLKWPFMLQQV